MEQFAQRGFAVLQQHDILRAIVQHDIALVGIGRGEPQAQQFAVRQRNAPRFIRFEFEIIVILVLWIGRGEPFVRRLLRQNVVESLRTRAMRQKDQAQPKRCQLPANEFAAREPGQPSLTQRN